MTWASLLGLYEHLSCHHSCDKYFSSPYKIRHCSLVRIDGRSDYLWFYRLSSVLRMMKFDWDSLSSWVIQSFRCLHQWAWSTRARESNWSNIGDWNLLPKIQIKPRNSISRRIASANIFVSSQSVKSRITHGISATCTTQRRALVKEHHYPLLKGNHPPLTRSIWRVGDWALKKFISGM